MKRLSLVRRRTSCRLASPLPARRGASGMPVALAALLVAAAPIAPVSAAAAQEYDVESPKLYRKWLFAGIGASIGVVPAMLAQPGDVDAKGACVSKTCMMSLAGVMGATIGYMIGRERDQAVAARHVAGPTIRFRTQAVQLNLVPYRLAAFDGGVVVVGQQGLATVGADRSVRLRGGEIRGIEAAAALPAHNALLAATPSGIFSFPLQGEQAEGQLVLRNGGGALETVSTDQVVLGGGDLLRRLRLSGQGSLLQLAEEARVDAVGPAPGLAYASYEGVLWSLSRDRLVARSASQLTELGGVDLPVPGRSVSVSGNRALVTAGTEGLLIVDIERPEAPQLVGQIQGIQFAFDGVLQGDVAYIAAGRLGLLVVDVSEPARPKTLGVARDLGFVNDIAVGAGGEIYAIDREGQRLFVVQQPNARDRVSSDRN